MKHVRMLGTCLVALLALGAVVASSASAGLPEFGGCEPTPRGAYTDSACVHKAAHRKSAEGKYEWYTGAEFGRVAKEAKHEPPNTLAGYALEGSLGSATFATTSGKSIACGEGEVLFNLENAEDETVGAEFENPVTIRGTTKGIKNVLLVFRGCESEGQPCTSPKAEEPGEITNEDAYYLRTSEDAVGKLGWINREKGEVGLSLTTLVKTTKSGRQFLLVADCEGAVGTVNIGGETQGKNTVISLITPTDVMTSSFTDTFAQSGGEQIPSAFEGQRESSLRAFLSNENTWEKLGISTTFALRKEFAGAPPIEIKTEP